jgi:DnaJ-domain-containing protein 1
LAEADIHGITYNARQLIREVAFLLGLSSEALSQVEVRPTKLDEDACSLLGLPTDADAEEVRRVYRLLASQFHPDVNSVLSPDQVRQSNEAFVRIKEAYERLMSQLGEH